MITPAQIHAARALLGWSHDELAERSGVPKPTIMRFEASEDNAAAGGHAGARERLVTALESAGVTFQSGDDDGVGVRLRKPTPDAIPVEDLNASNDE